MTGFNIKPIQATPAFDWQWITIAGPNSLHFHFAIGLDAVSLLFAAGCALAAMGAFLIVQKKQTVCLIVLFCCATLCLQLMFTAANLLQLFLFWELSALFGSGMLLLSNPKQQNGSLTGKWTVQFLTDRIAGIFLIVGIAFLWVHGQTLDIFQLLQRVTEFSGESAHLRVVGSAIGYCVVTAVLIRTGQFPFCAWLHIANESLAESDHHAVDHHNQNLRLNLALGWQIGLAMPGCIYVLVRFLPLLQQDPQLVFSLSAFCALSIIVCTFIALTTRSWQTGLTDLAIAQLAIMMIGLLNAHPVTQTAALFFLPVHMLIFTILWLTFAHYSGLRCVQLQQATSDPRVHNTYAPIVLFTLCGLSVVWLSGLWGQNAILALVSFKPLFNLSGFNPAAGPGSFNLGPGMLCVFLFLINCSYVRMLLLVRRGASAEQRTIHQNLSEQLEVHSSRSLITSGIMVMLLMSGVTLWLAVAPAQFGAYLSQHTWERHTWNSQSLLQLDVGTLAALSGLLTAWLLYQSPNAWPERIARFFGPMHRLASNQFYLAELTHYGLNMPVRTAALLLRFLEWVLIDQVALGTLKSLTELVSRLARPLQTGQLQLYLLSILLSLSVLMILLIGN